MTMPTGTEQSGRRRLRRVLLRDMLLGMGVGYLAGSVSFSRLLGQWRAPGVDFSHAEILVEQTGETIVMGGTTPTSVGVHLGNRWAGVAVGLEAAKAAIPTALARRLSDDPRVAAATAAGAVLGHAYPLTQRGQRGGYGASPIIGGMAVLDPLGLVVTNAVMVGVIAATRESRLVLLWPATIPVWAAVRRRNDLVGYALAVNVILWSRVVPELRSSMAGMLTRQ
jgi:glycerol-3-phosphate acyltransferase PlsY